MIVIFVPETKELSFFPAGGGLVRCERRYCQQSLPRLSLHLLSRDPHSSVVFVCFVFASAPVSAHVVCYVNYVNYVCRSVGTTLRLRLPIFTPLSINRTGTGFTRSGQWMRIKIPPPPPPTHTHNVSSRAGVS